MKVIHARGDPVSRVSCSDAQSSVEAEGRPLDKLLASLLIDLPKSTHRPLLELSGTSSAAPQRRRMLCKQHLCPLLWVAVQSGIGLISGVAFLGFSDQLCD